MSRVLWVGLIVVLLLGAGLWVFGLLPHCCGARQTPSRAEATLARRLRSWSLPSGPGRGGTLSPVRPSCCGNRPGISPIIALVATAMTEAAAPRLDENLYPPAPDMRLATTQELSDGELDYIIHNGVRWAGMPAWGEPGNDNDQDTWKLVLFLRHLPTLTAGEIRDMERFNPRSDADREEEKEEKEFLNGGRSGDSAQKPR